MNVCICCHDTLLHHVGNGRVYWFCPRCHCEMPSQKTQPRQALLRQPVAHFVDRLAVVSP